MINVLLNLKTNSMNKKKCLFIVSNFLSTLSSTRFSKKDILYKMLLIVKSLENMLNVFFEPSKISNSLTLKINSTSFTMVSISN